MHDNAGIETCGEVEKSHLDSYLAELVGNGSKERAITLNRKACNALKAYLAVRPVGDSSD